MSNQTIVDCSASDGEIIAASLLPPMSPRAMISRESKKSKHSHDPLPPEIDRHLTSYEARNRYRKYCNLKVPPGRPVIFRDFEDLDLLSHFQASHLHSILDRSFFQGVYPFLVKLFYSNMEVVVDHNPPTTLTTNVLGTPITLDDHSLGTILGLPCHGRRLPDLRFPTETVARALVLTPKFRPDVEVASGNLQPVPRLVARVLNHNLQCKMGSFNYISRDVASLTYAVLQGIEVNWPSVILEEMKGPHSCFLPFGSLITHVLDRHGVRMRPFERVSSLEPFDRSTRLRMKIDGIVRGGGGGAGEDGGGEVGDRACSLPPPVRREEEEGGGESSCSWRWHGKRLEDGEGVTLQDLADAFTAIFGGMSELKRGQERIRREIKRIRGEFHEESSKTRMFVEDLCGDRKKKKKFSQVHINESGSTLSTWQPPSQSIQSSPSSDNCNGSGSNDKGHHAPNHSKQISRDCPASCCSQCFRLQGELSRMAEKVENFKTCKVCMEKDVSMLLLPCRHFCLCKECEPKLHVCPICNTAKACSLEVFMS